MKKFIIIAALTTLFLFPGKDTCTSIVYNLGKITSIEYQVESVIGGFLGYGYLKPFTTIKTECGAVICVEDSVSGIVGSNCTLYVYKKHNLRLWNSEIDTGFGLVKVSLHQR